MVAAPPYIYVPYHLVDSYVRADLGEFTAFAFLPLIVFGFSRLLEADDRSDRVAWIAVSALAYGGLILTHMIAALIFTPLLGSYVLFISLLARPRSFIKGWLLRLIFAGAAALLALAASAVYWLPGLVETRYVQSANLVGGFYSYRNHFVYLFQLFSPFWGYGYAGIGPNDQMPFQIGLVPVVFGLGAAGVFFTNRELRPYLWFFVAAALVYTLAMLSLAQPLWQAGQRLAVFVQFPWRLLMVVTFTASLMAGAVARSFTGKEPGVMNAGVAAVLLLVLTTGFPYSAPQYTEANVSLKGMIQFQLDTGELLGDTIWVSQRPTSSPLVPLYLEGRPLVKAAALDGEAKVMTVSHGAVSEAIEVLAPRGTSVLFYNHYFPGWRGFLDGQEIAIKPQGPQGLISLEVPAGEHRVEIRFGDTAARTFGKLLSLLGWVIALVAFFGAKIWRLSLPVKKAL
ncbi:MAG: hypothetical protein HY783_08340 [Chloroflexi bacterium]|nr:hypothetical protein [Chloroflexota bacterium]